MYNGKRKALKTQEVEDVYEETSGIARDMAENVLNGLASDLLTKDLNHKESFQC